jgi:hypothetical protein
MGRADPGRVGQQPKRLAREAQRLQPVREYRANKSKQIQIKPSKKGAA